MPMPPPRGGAHESTPIFRLKKLKPLGTWISAANHNLRAFDVTKGRNINPSRVQFNAVIVGSCHPQEIVECVTTKIAALAHKPRKDAVIGVEAVFSLPKHIQLPNDVQDRFFRACIAWAETWCGGARNIVSAIVHRDEAAPHCHLLVLPVLDGVLKGSAMVGGRAQLIAKHNEFVAQVWNKFPELAPRATKPIGFDAPAAEKPILCRIRGKQPRTERNARSEAGASLCDLSAYTIPTFTDWAEAAKQTHQQLNGL